MKGVNLTYLKNRIDGLLAIKQRELERKLFEESTKALEAEQDALRAKKLEYLATFPVTDVAEAMLAKQPYAERDLHPLLLDLRRKFKKEDERLRKQSDHGYGLEREAKQKALNIIERKRIEVLDKVMLGDNKDAVTVLAALEKWNPAK